MIDTDAQNTWFIELNRLSGLKRKSPRTTHGQVTVDTSLIDPLSLNRMRRSFQLSQIIIYSVNIG